MNPIYYSFLFDFDITSRFTYTSIIEVTLMQSNLI